MYASFRFEDARATEDTLYKYQHHQIDETVEKAGRACVSHGRGFN